MVLTKLRFKHQILLTKKEINLNNNKYKLIKKDRQTCGIDIVGLLIMDVMQPFSVLVSSKFVDFLTESPISV